MKSEGKPRLRHQSAGALRAALGAGELSVAALAEEVQSYIARHDPDIHAFVYVPERLEDDVARAERMIAEGAATPLTGIPVAVKDNILVKEWPATAGSKMLEPYTAAYDATVVQKLRAAGAVIVGKTNMDEFAMGSSGENSAFGPTKNPVDTSRVPGGSSSGSAAAVAMGAVPLALGSDTGGSIRQPAAFCGAVGFKPTYGAVSRYGLIAMGSSLDQIGPIAHSVTDTETLYAAIRGYDPLDSTSLPDDHAVFAERAERKTIGVPSRFLGEALDADVRENFEASIERLQSLGYTVRDIELPHVEHSLAVYYIIMPAEVSTNLSRFDGMRYGLYVAGEDLLGDYLNTRSSGFGAEPRRRIVLGTYVLSSGYYDAYYGKAALLRRRITESFTGAFREVDAIALPTAPTPAFAFGEKSDPLSMYLQDIFTVPANLAGIPSLSVPSGTVVRGKAPLPVGVQLMGAWGADTALFSVGKRFLGEA